MESLNLFYGNALLLLLVVIECAITRFVLKEELPWRELIMNLNSGHILLWVFRGLEVASYYFLYSQFSYQLLSDMNPLAIIVFAFIAWDFSFYWLHRLHHKISLFWSVHVIHHEGEHYSLSLGIRNSWYSSLTSLPFFIWLAILGVPGNVFLLVSGALILFASLLFYIYIENSLLGLNQFYLFALVFTGTIALGGFSDNTKWGLILWCIFSIGGCGTYLLLGKEVVPILRILLLFAIAHGILTFYWVQTDKLNNE